MEIEVGTKYNTREGGTDTIVYPWRSETYPFLGASGERYSADGGYYCGNPDGDPRDLISEYVEPPEEPRGSVRDADISEYLGIGGPIDAAKGLADVGWGHVVMKPCSEKGDGIHSHYGVGKSVRFPAAEATITTDYQRGVNDAVLWLLSNYAEFKPEYLAENMLKELNND